MERRYQSVEKSNWDDPFALEAVYGPRGQPGQLEPSCCDPLDPRSMPWVLKSYPHFSLPQEMELQRKTYLRVSGLVGLPNANHHDLHLQQDHYEGGQYDQSAGERNEYFVELISIWYS